MRHALSVDVEDWYHDSGAITSDAGERVERNTDRLLELLAAVGASATFFVLGEVAVRYPQLVRRIAAAGHELGSHAFHHRRVMEMTQREFRTELHDSRTAIEDAAGQPVYGFRAPYFSIKAAVRWPVELIAECGFRYDASILAIDRPPGLELVSPRAPYRLHNGLWEVPVGVLRVGPFWHLPLASGNGLRLLPPALLRRLIARFEREVGAAVFYLHPWELNDDSPTGTGPGRWLLGVGRRKIEARLQDLARRSPLRSIVEVFAQVVA